MGPHTKFRVFAFIQFLDALAPSYGPFFRVAKLIARARRGVVRCRFIKIDKSTLFPPKES